MRNSKTQYLLYRYIGKTIEDHESLYYEPFYKNFGDDVLDDSDIKYIKSNHNDGWKGEASAIDIDYMIETLTNLKKEGATHVEIMHHTDHDSYCISGVEIRKPTQDEIYIHIGEDAEKRKIGIEQQMEQLKKQMALLEEERKKVL